MSIINVLVFWFWFTIKYWSLQSSGGSLLGYKSMAAVAELLQTVLAAGAKMISSTFACGKFERKTPSLLRSDVSPFSCNFFFCYTSKFCAHFFFFCFCFQSTVLCIFFSLHFYFSSIVFNLCVFFFFVFDQIGFFFFVIFRCTNLRTTN